ncbi:uncharacterized protein LOC144468321, partial [Augochlora pura]
NSDLIIRVCAGSSINQSLFDRDFQFTQSYILISRDLVRGRVLVWKVQNTGSCPLVFGFRVRDTLEGNIPAAQADESPKETRKKKGKSDGKSSKNLRLDEALRPQEQLLISDGGLARSAHPECFSFANLDEDARLLVPEARKMEFGIRFQRPKKERSDKEKSEEKSAKKRSKAKESSKKEDGEKLNYCYVAFVEVTLGGSVHVQDFVIICSVK